MKTNTITNEMIKAALPFKNPRPAQVRALTFIAKAWEDGYDTVVLDLPTGVGKSGVAIGASRLSAQIPRNGENMDEGSWLLTTQKTLQAQYAREFPDFISSVSSKSNYPCVSYEGKESCEKGYRWEKKTHGKTLAEYLSTVKKTPQTQHIHDMCHRLMAQGHDTSPCAQDGICPYKTAWLNWLGSDIGVTNLAFFLNLVRAKSLNRSLLIVDEAHTVEEELVNFLSMDISEKFLKNDLKMTAPVLRNLAEMRDFVKDSMLPRMKKLRQSLEAESMTMAMQGQNTSLVDRRFRQIDSSLRKAVSFISDKNPDDWVFCSDKDGNQAARPLHTGRVGADMLLTQGKRHLFMSGTILDVDQFCQTVGLERSRVKYYSEDSPFDAEKRVVVVRDCGSMGRKGFDSAWPKAKKNLEMILDRHKGQKGIIHTGTYRLAQMLEQEVKSSRFLFHADAREREAILEEHAKSKKDTVLVSPSMTVGVDLKGDLADFGVILKAPFLYLGDERIRKLFDEDKGWYNWKTLQEIMQMCGRIHRDDNDDTVMYILDGDAIRLIHSSSKIVPSWWMAGLFSEDAT